MFPPRSISGSRTGIRAKLVARNRAAFLRAVLGQKFGQQPTPQSAPHAETAESLVTLRQIHSDVVRVFPTPAATAPQADAAISSHAGLFLGIQTADCVPILLADPRRHVVAAVHAGWRGTLARIAVKTLGRMRLEFGTNPEDVLAALGPAIGPCCYEVGPEVAQAFLGQFAHAAEWFEGPFERLSSGEEPNPLPWLTMMPPGHEPPPERVQLDLRSANRRQLVDAGVRPAEHCRERALHLLPQRPFFQLSKRRPCHRPHDERGWNPREIALGGTCSGRRG